MYTHKGKENKIMTRFERHKNEIKNGANGIIILRERKAELLQIEKQGKAEKNSFRQDCLAQEFVKLQREYDELAELV